MPADIFQFLTAGDQDLLRKGARPAGYHRGDVLFHEGDVQPNLYVVRAGWVRVDRNYQDESIAVARYGPGEVLGEVAFLTQQTARRSVVAEEDVQVDVLEGRHIQALLASDSGFASRFYHSLALCLGERLVQVLPGIQLSEALGGAGTRPRLQRTGQLTERQLPKELITAVEAFRVAMHALAAELRQEGLDPNLAVFLPRSHRPLAAKLREERSDPQAAQRRVNHQCDAVVDLLNRFTQDGTLVAMGMDDLLAFRDVADLARGVGGYVFREAFPFFMQSATIAPQAYERPRGYAEDRDLLARIERNEPEGDGQLGPRIDQWFLGRPMCRSRRTMLRTLTAFLAEQTAGSRDAPLRLTSLSAGTAQEVFDLLAATCQPLYVTCIDRDPDALVVKAERARQLGCAQRVTFLQADVPAIAGGQTPVSLGPQHVIYGLGLCDYLEDEQVRGLLDWVHGLLVPGGWIVLTNRDTASPDRAFIEHILDWPVIHRTPEEFRSLFAQSRFASLGLELQRDEAGVTLVARCRKN